LVAAIGKNASIGFVSPHSVHVRTPGSCFDFGPVFTGSLGFGAMSRGGLAALAARQGLQRVWV
jgi:hypothetical protein